MIYSTPNTLEPSMEPTEVKLPEQLSTEDIEDIVLEWNQILNKYSSVGSIPELNYKEQVLKNTYPNLDIEKFWNYFEVEGTTQLKLVKK